MWLISIISEVDVFLNLSAKFSKMFAPNMNKSIKLLLKLGYAPIPPSIMIYNLFLYHCFPDIQKTVEFIRYRPIGIALYCNPLIEKPFVCEKQSQQKKVYLIFVFQG